MQGGTMDDDDKIRRNLVVFSAAVLVVAWLEIPVQPVVAKWLGAEGWRLHPVKLWLAVLAVDVYLILRFRFGDQTRETAEELTKVHRKRWRASVLNLIGGDFDAAKKLYVSDSPTDMIRTLARQKFGTPPDMTESEIESLYSSQKGSAVLVKLDPKSASKGTFSANVSLFGENNRIDANEQLHGTYRFPLWRALSSYLRPWFPTVFYSKGSIELIAPSVLAFAATCVILWRMFDSF